MTQAKVEFRRIALVSGLLLIFFLQSYAAISSKSATFDEAQNFGIGKYLLQHRTWDVMGCILNPPLALYLSSIPLFAMHESEDVWKYDQRQRDLTFLTAVDAYRSQELLSDASNKDDRMLIRSRLMLLLPTLLLGWYIYRLSRELYGDGGAYLSLALFAFSPNMLAYSAIANSDMPLTISAFIACYYFRCYLSSPAAAPALLTGIFLGLALLAKFNGVLLVPYLLLLYLLHRALSRQGFDWRILLTFVLAIGILFLGYFGDLTPYLQGYRFRMMQYDSGFSSYFHGSYSLHGWWYYYPFVLLVKTPIPLLLLFTAASYLHFRRPAGTWFDVFFLMAPVFGLLVLFISSGIATGIRYLLPIFPFVFVLCGILVRDWSRLKIPLIGLLVWYCGRSVATAPNYLAYFNELVGGPDRAYRYLVDSNLDWGQDLKGLKRYMDAHGIKRISLSYFGVDSPKRYGIDYDWLPSFHLFNPSPESVGTFPKNRYVAISATNLQGVYLEPKDIFSWFRQFEPVSKIGYSIFIYDMEKLPSFGQ